MPHRITVANQKGGAGKTTDVIHAGGALANQGHNVLLVDIDYHGGLTCSLGHDDLYYDTDRRTLFDILDFDQMEHIEDVIQHGDEFDILPASEKLANNANIQTLADAPKSRERLNLALDELGERYDYIIIDTPPSLNILTDNAIVATKNVIIPVIPEELNANSLRIFGKQLSYLEKAYGNINRLCIIANRVEQNKEHYDTIEEIRGAYSIPVFEIPKRTDLSKSIADGGSIFTYGIKNSRVTDAKEIFTEIAEHVTHELTAGEEVEA